MKNRVTDSLLAQLHNGTIARKAPADRQSALLVHIIVSTDIQIRIIVESRVVEATDEQVAAWTLITCVNRY